MSVTKKFRILKFKKKPLLVAKKISKSFDRPVLDKISFSLWNGEIFGVLGPNGCGKTTLFNCLLGIHKLDGGDFFIKEQSLKNLPIHIRARRFQLSYVPQNSACFLGLDVSSNIESICEIKIKDKIKRKDMLQEVLARFNLEPIKTTLAKKLSGGERRRLSIGMALVTKPSLLLLDEPFSALDPLSVETIRKIITDLQHSSISVMLSDHNISTTLATCDRAILISQGSVVASGLPREIVNNSVARKLYFGESFKF